MKRLANKGIAISVALALALSTPISVLSNPFNVMAAESSSYEIKGYVSIREYEEGDDPDPEDFIQEPDDDLEYKFVDGYEFDDTVEEGEVKVYAVDPDGLETNTVTVDYEITDYSNYEDGDDVDVEITIEDYYSGDEVDSYTEELEFGEKYYVDEFDIPNDYYYEDDYEHFDVDDDAVDDGVTIYVIADEYEIEYIIYTTDDGDDWDKEDTVTIEYDGGERIDEDDIYDDLDLDDSDVYELDPDQSTYIIGEEDEIKVYLEEDVNWGDSNDYDHEIEYIIYTSDDGDDWSREDTYTVGYDYDDVIDQDDIYDDLDLNENDVYEISPDRTSYDVEDYDTIKIYLDEDEDWNEPGSKDNTHEIEYIIYTSDDGEDWYKEDTYTVEYDEDDNIDKDDIYDDLEIDEDDVDRLSPSRSSYDVEDYDEIKVYLEEDVDWDDPEEDTHEIDYVIYVTDDGDEWDKEDTYTVEYDSDDTIDEDDIYDDLEIDEDDVDRLSPSSSKYDVEDYNTIKVYLDEDVDWNSPDDDYDHEIEYIIYTSNDGDEWDKEDTYTVDYDSDDTIDEDDIYDDLEIDEDDVYKLSPSRSSYDVEDYDEIKVYLEEDVDWEEPEADDGLPNDIDETVIKYYDIDGNLLQTEVVSDDQMEAAGDLTPSDYFDYSDEYALEESAHNVIPLYSVEDEYTFVASKYATGTDNNNNSNSSSNADVTGIINNWDATYTITSPNVGGTTAPNAGNTIDSYYPVLGAGFYTGRSYSNQTNYAYLLPDDAIYTDYSTPTLASYNGVMTVQVDKDATYTNYLNGDVDESGQTLARPYDTLTRAEFAQMLYAGTNGAASSDTLNYALYDKFSDVSSADGMWYQAPLTWAIQNGFVSGYDDNTLRPNGTITDAELYAIITRIPTMAPKLVYESGSPSAEIIGLTENESGQWYSDNLMTALIDGYIYDNAGYISAKTTNGEMKQASRIDAVYAINQLTGRNYAELEGYTMSPQVTFADVTYSDMNSNPDSKTSYDPIIRASSTLND